MSELQPSSKFDNPYECDVKSKEVPPRNLSSCSDDNQGISSPQAYRFRGATVAHYQLQDTLSLTEQVTRFWSTDWESIWSESASTLPGKANRRDENKSKPIKKLRGDAFEKLMANISACIPVARFKTKGDLDYCLEAIKTYIDRRNPGALEFVKLVQTAAFEELHIRMLSFSNVTTKVKIMNPAALVIHEPGDTEALLAWLDSDPPIFRPQSLRFPTSAQYDVFKELVERFLVFFHQSSEQVAVMKVAGYNLLLQYVNRDLCSRFYSELGLFNLSSEESPAEVVARVAEQKYRYFLTGRADGFIVTLTVTVDDHPDQREALVNARAQGTLLKKCSPVTLKYQELLKRLNSTIEMLDQVGTTGRISYEIVLLEVKRLALHDQSAANSASRADGQRDGDVDEGPRSFNVDQGSPTRLIQHLKQIISECAAIKEYGPEKCRILKFILTDGDHWLYGLLKNPHTGMVEQGSRREAFYIILDNGNLERTSMLLKLLAAWMVVPGNVLLRFFQPSGNDGSLTAH